MHLPRHTLSHVFQENEALQQFFAGAVPIDPRNDQAKAVYEWTKCVQEAVLRSLEPKLPTGGEALLVGVGKLITTPSSYS